MDPLSAHCWYAIVVSVGGIFLWINDLSYKKSFFITCAVSQIMTLVYIGYEIVGYTRNMQNQEAHFHYIGIIKEIVFLGLHGAIVSCLCLAIKKLLIERLEILQNSPQK